MTGVEDIYAIDEDKEREIKEQNESSVISPKETVVRKWNITIVLLSLLSVSFSLFELFFDSTIGVIRGIRYGFDVVFLINIISRFYIGYEYNGVVINNDAQLVRRNYLKTWFLIDALGVIPLEFVGFMYPEWHFLHFTRCFRILRMFDLIFSMQKEPDTNKIHVFMLNTLSVVVLSVQLSAYLLFYQVCSPKYSDISPNCTLLEENWIHLEEKGEWNKVLFYKDAIYWAAVVLFTLGYGDLHATTANEATVASVIMLIGVFAIAGYVMTDMSSIISNLDARKGKFFVRMESIRHHMKHMGLPEEVQTLVEIYYDYLWTHRNGTTLAGLWNELPFPLLTEISSASYKALMEKTTLFDNTDSDFKRALSCKLQKHIFSQGLSLVKPGDLNPKLYYIEHGLVQVHDQTDLVATLLPGSLFGEAYVLYNIPRNVTISAATLCEVTVLERNDLLELFADYPEAGLKIARTARNRLHTVKHPIREAFSLGVASMPKKVVFQKDLRENLEPRDQRIFTLFMEYTSSSRKVPSSVKAANDVCKYSWMRTIRPDSLFAKKWDVFVFWCITVSIFIHIWVLFFTNNKETTGVLLTHLPNQWTYFQTPYEIVSIQNELLCLSYQGFFKVGPGAVILSICAAIDIIAMIDIFINLRTEVLTTDGNLSDMAGIFKNYRASWNLHYDFLAVFPLDLFSFIASSKSHWHLLGYSRLNRLIWLRKLYMYLEKWESDIKNNLLKQRTAKCMFLLILFVHCCAGFMYMSGCGKNRCDQGSWAWNNGLEYYKSNFYHYTLSAYFAMVTMTSVGYGDISPGTTSDKFTAAAIGVMGSFVFNYIISQIYATMSSRSGPRVKFQNHLSAMKLVMESHNLSASLQKRVVNYMSLLWSKYHGQTYPGGPSLVHDVPMELQHIILMNERGDLLSRIPYFEQTGQDFILDLAKKSVVYFFPRGEIIQYSETISRELFCIKRGTCQVLTDDLSEIVGVYGEKMYFGEAGFLFAKQALMTVRAKTFCEILVIDFDKMMTILDNYPAIKGQIEELCSNSLYYNSLVQCVEETIHLKGCKSVEPNLDAKNKGSPLNYKRRRFSSKSQCYVEDFGNFPIYARAKEETIEEHLLRLNKNQPFCSRPTRAILPSNPVYVRWEMFRILLAIIVSVLSSLHFAFLYEKTEMWITCYVLGLFCWIDMYIRLHVAFYKDGHLQVDTMETAKYYMKNGFLMDFIFCFPWDVFGWLVISPFFSDGFYGNPVALHRYAYMRVPHILQLYRLPLAFSYWQSGIATEKGHITLFKFLIYFVLFLHFSSCIVFASVCLPGDHTKTWNMSKYMLPAMKQNCSKFSWVSHLETRINIDFETASFLHMYTISVYFAAATICGVGYGDIHPRITYMRAAVSFIIVTSALCCGFMAGTIAAMLANADAPRVEFAEKKESIKSFLKSQFITGRLYVSTLRFYTFKWIKTKGIDQETLFEQLPSSIYGDIATIIYADVIANAFGLNIKRRPRRETVCETLTPLERKLSGKINGPIFQRALSKECVDHMEMDGGFIRMLATQIRPCLYRADDYICQRNDIGSEMYFIQKGEVEVLSLCETSVVTRFKAGQYFGEQSLLFEQLRAATIRATTDCDLYVLTKLNLHKTVKYYPDILEQIKRAAERNQEQVDQSGPLKETDADKRLKETGYVKLPLQCGKEQQQRLPLGLKWKNYVSGLLKHLVELHNITIDPENPIRVLYQYTSCLLIILSFWAITYMEVAFLTPGIFIFTMVIEYVQMAEIIMKFHISYYDRNGRFVSDYKSVSWNYMSSKMGLVFDLLCSFPYGLTVIHMARSPESRHFLQIINLVRAGHLLRILSVFHFIYKEEQNFTTNLNIIRVVKFLVQYVIFIHLVAVLFTCFWLFNGSDSWAASRDYEDLAVVYIYSVYWALNTYTSTGFGDITATNMQEILFSIIVIVLSKMHLCYSMGMLASTKTNKEALQVAYEEKLQAIHKYMLHEKIPTPLQNRVMHFYHYQWTRTRGIDCETLFRDIPRSLKSQILCRMCITMLRKHQLFIHVSEAFMRQLATRMQMKSYTAGEYITRRGDMGTGMILILSGTVKLCSSSDKQESDVILTTGAVFGAKQLFERHSWGDTAIADNYVDILFLAKEIFDELGPHYPRAMEKVSARFSNMVSLY
ncbi:unnamed protein product [Lota lota]